MKTGQERIQEERTRQISVEGWHADHDRQHSEGTLYSAGVCYEAAGDTIREHGPVYVVCFSIWPFEVQWWKPAVTAERNYEKAGALFKAEADRYRGLGDYDNARRMDQESDRCAEKLDAITKPKTILTITK